MTKGPSVCMIDGCNRPMLARDRCSTHYARWRRHESSQAAEHRAADAVVSENYRKRNPTKIKALSVRRYANGAERLKARASGYRKKLRQELLDAYGRVCACCGETEEAFLTLEHIGGTGAAHRRSLSSSCSVYHDLKKRGWPKNGYEILCWNCNCAQRYGKVCPHKLKTQVAA
jgi:hypothetical protein